MSRRGIQTSGHACGKQWSVISNGTRTIYCTRLIFIWVDLRDCHPFQVSHTTPRSLHFHYTLQQKTSNLMCHKEHKPFLHQKTRSQFAKPKLCQLIPVYVCSSILANIPQLHHQTHAPACHSFPLVITCKHCAIRQMKVTHNRNIF